VSESSDNKKLVEIRGQRHTSHALVELRKFKYLPFKIYSAVLLDISLGGFMLEFTGEVNAAPGESFWLQIPLAPLGIYSPTKLMCRAECRWFDPKKYRIGGVFMRLDKTEQHVIEQALDTLQKRGGLTGYSP
jgi:hypothetical protein